MITTRRASFIQLLATLILLLSASCGNKDLDRSRAEIQLNLPSGTQEILLGREALGNPIRLHSLHLELQQDSTIQLSIDGEEKFLFPDFYFLKVNERYYPLLIDSITENVELKITGKGPLDYTVSGENNNKLKHVDSLILSAEELTDSLFKARRGTSGGKRAEYDSKIQRAFTEAKDQLSQFAFRNLKSFIGYYVLNADFNGTPLYYSRDKQDVRLFSSVSSALGFYYPTHYRTKQVQEITNAAIRKSRSQRILDSFEDLDSSLPDIVLPNTEGSIESLSEHKDKAVLLCFWSYEHPNEGFPEYLQIISEKYADKGLVILQVCLAKNKKIWEAYLADHQMHGKGRINLIDEQGPGSKYAQLYNISSLPSFYVIGPGQDIYPRTANLDEIEANIEKAL